MSASDTLDRIVKEMQDRLAEIRPQADALMAEVNKLEAAITALESGRPEPTARPRRNNSRQPVERIVHWDEEAQDAYVINAQTGERVRGRVKDDEKAIIEKLKAEHAVAA